MKYLLLVALGVCNQAIFDQLYLQTLSWNFQSNLVKVKGINEHNQYVVDKMDLDKADFNIIRQLCHGQKSTYEGK